MRLLTLWLYVACLATFFVCFLDLAGCLPRRVTRLALCHLLVAALAVVMCCVLGRR